MESSNPLKIAFGSDSLKLKLDQIELGCFILQNGLHVFSKDGIQRAMGYDGKSTNWLAEFLNHINRLMPIDPDLLEALLSNVVFEKTQNNGAIVLREGIMPEILIAACKAIIKAKNEGFLFVSELKFAKAAETIIKNTEGADISKLIDFATGYERYKQNHKDALYRFMKRIYPEDYVLWVKTLPDDFFEALFQFKEWEWADLNENAAEVSDYLQDIVFARISGALMETLNGSKPKMKYRKGNFTEQYLENHELSAHLHSILALIKASEENENLFQLLLNNTFPKQRNFIKTRNFTASKEAFTPEQLKFNESLKKTVKTLKSKKS